MDLREIEEKADDLLEQMYREVTGPAGAAEMRDICTRMDVLERAARIKHLSGSHGLCSEHFPGHPSLPCTLYSGHSGQHQHEGGETDPSARWDGESGLAFQNITEPTKPAVDRLHELVSYCKQNAEAADAYAITPDEHQVVAEAKAYRDIATKLEEILREGSL